MSVTPTSPGIELNPGVSARFSIHSSGGRPNIAPTLFAWPGYPGFLALCFGFLGMGGKQIISPFSTAQVVIDSGDIIPWCSGFRFAASAAQRPHSPRFGWRALSLQANIRAH